MPVSYRSIKPDRAYSFAWPGRSNDQTPNRMITAVANETSELKAEYDLRYVWLISIVAAMGGLLFGWDWVVIGGAKPFFQRYFELTSEAQIGWANSCALIG